MNGEMWPWAVFAAMVIVMLAVDLGLHRRHPHAIGIKEALVWSAVWIGIALGFNAGIWYVMGSGPALDFLGAYVLEKALSIDNLFVFMMIFGTFRIRAADQHKILIMGILGALVMRAVFIAAGVTLLQTFRWATYVLGAFLFYTGYRMYRNQEEQIDLASNPVLAFCRKFIPMTHDHRGDAFFVREDGRLLATPLLMVLMLVESTDLVFAVDSIPAVLAITQEPFLVYTSNVFAILGLRALYFALAGAAALFHHLKQGLSFILAFVGLKMILQGHYHIPMGFSLGVIAAVLLLSVLASLWWPQPEESAPRSP